jgi:hypothetical protein
MVAPQVAAIVVLEPDVSWSGQLLNSDQTGKFSRDDPLTNPAIASGVRSSKSCPRILLSLSPQVLMEKCRQQGLAGFKLPRHIAAQYQPLQKNTSGKVFKHAVRDLLIDSLQTPRPRM